MAWRIHLSDRPIRRLDILSGKPRLLAAWTQNTRVSYLDLQTGSPRGDRTIDDVPVGDRRSEAWQTFMQSLTAPNEVFLPYVRTKQAAISISADGRMRLYQTSPTDLFLEIDGKESRLVIDGEASFLAVGMDRSLGLLAALDTEAKLHLYQQHIRVGTFETGLTIDEQFRPTLTIPQDGTVLYLTDGRSIVVMDSAGRVRQRLDLHYTLGAMNCSPNGKRFVTSDLDANVIRIYDSSLTPTHQRFAVDLLVEAKRAQLLPSPGMSSAALGPIAINNKGVLAFALSGALCVTNLAKMKAYPKPV